MKINYKLLAPVIIILLAGCQLKGAKHKTEGRGDFLLVSTITNKELEFDIYELNDFKIQKITKKENDYGSIVYYTLHLDGEDGVINIKKLNGWNSLPREEIILADEDAKFINKLNGTKYYTHIEEPKRINFPRRFGKGMYTYGNRSGKRCFSSVTAHNIKAMGSDNTNYFDTLIDIRYCGFEPTEDLIKWLQSIRLKGSPTF